MTIPEAVGKLTCLKYFPQNAEAHAALMSLLSRMISDETQLDWLVRTLIDRVGEYYGPDQIRAVFCVKFKPKDGIECELKEGHPLFRTEEQLISEYQFIEAGKRGMELDHFQIRASHENQRLLSGNVEPPPPIQEILAPLVQAKAMPKPEPVPDALEAQVLHARAAEALRRNIAEQEAWERRFKRKPENWAGPITPEDVEALRRA